MNYTKYFGIVTRENGQLNLANEQFSRMMNIVYLEGVIMGLNKVKETLKDTNEYYKYDMLIFKHNSNLTLLTGNLQPELLVNEMLSFSEN
jgi:hypothetical protein